MRDGWRLKMDDGWMVIEDGSKIENGWKTKD